MVRLVVDSYYYARFFDEIGGRLDENYNNPKYDEINHQLKRSKYGSATLGDDKYLVNIVSGKTPKGIKHLQEEEGVPFLGATQILFGKINIADSPRIAKEVHNGVLASSKIKKNNVLITIAGMNLGRSAAYLSVDECNANQAVAILTLNENEVEPEFLVHYLNSKLGQLFIGKFQHISSQPNINLEEIKKIKTIFPDKTTQIEIMKKVKSIEAQATKLEDNEEDVTKEANSLLLKEMGFDAIPQKKYFFKEGEGDSVCFYIFSDQLSNRMSYLFYHPAHIIFKKFQDKYETEKLGEICKEPIKRGVQAEYSETGEVVVIKTIDMKNSYIDFENCLKVSRDFYNSVPQAHLKKGDILIATTGYGSLGKIDIYDRDEPAIAALDLVRLRLAPSYDPYFITYFLRSHLGAIQFEKWFSGSSGQIHIYESGLNRFVVPKDSGIPLKKQKEIAEKITKKMMEAFNLEQKSKEKWMEAQTLFEKMILA